MPTITLADLKRQVRARADMENDNGFITDQTLTDFINQSYLALYDYVILAWEDYFLNSFQFTLSGSQDGYVVPDDVYKLRGIDRQISGPNTWATVSRFNFNERNQFISPWGLLTRTIYPSVLYDWAGPNIKFIPQQQAAGIYQFWYIPILQTLTNDSDVLLSSMTKFYEYIVVSAAIKCLVKEESDALLVSLQTIEKRIKDMVPTKDNNQPSQLRSWMNAESTYGGWGWGGSF